MSASFEKTGLVVADWGCYDDWVGVSRYGFDLRF